MTYKTIENVLRLIFFKVVAIIMFGLQKRGHRLVDSIIDSAAAFLSVPHHILTSLGGDLFRMKFEQF